MMISWILPTGKQSQLLAFSVQRIAYCEKEFETGQIHIIRVNLWNLRFEKTKPILLAPGNVRWLTVTRCRRGKRKKKHSMITEYSWRYGLSGKTSANPGTCESQDRQDRQNIRRQANENKFLNLIKQKS